MAETSGIIIFMLWYIGIAYNYYVERINKRISSTSLSYDSGDEANDSRVPYEQKSDEGNILDEIFTIVPDSESPVVNKMMNSVEFSDVNFIPASGGNTVPASETISIAADDSASHQEFDVEELEPDVVDVDESSA
ncbi:uncharacterized protein LOC114247483 [Bombyx mandarina]|uniref:Uncharacterized protein LOC114247483 n=1 Tax=Bombyx mandarina TaxID=7092 RepID=A0A6J2K207_BOMMA|nr:uncharacterized protein LOC114247483 [Bombyx mandarina]